MNNAGAMSLNTLFPSCNPVYTKPADAYQQAITSTCHIPRPRNPIIYHLLILQTLPARNTPELRALNLQPRIQHLHP